MDYCQNLVPEADPNMLAAHKQLGPLLWSMVAVNESEAIAISTNATFLSELIQRALCNGRDVPLASSSVISPKDRHTTGERQAPIA